MSSSIIYFALKIDSNLKLEYVTFDFYNWFLVSDLLFDSFLHECIQIEIG